MNLFYMFNTSSESSFQYWLFAVVKNKCIKILFFACDIVLDSDLAPLLTTTSIKIVAAIFLRGQIVDRRLSDSKDPPPPPPTTH